MSKILLPRLRILAVVCGLAVSCIGVVAPVSAAPSVLPGTTQSTTTPATSAYQSAQRKSSGITISPAFQQVSIAANQPSVQYDFTVTNNSNSEYEFALSVVDFGSLDDTGGVLFVGNGQKSLSYRYALSPWVTLERDRIVVAAHATEKVPITVVNKESLSPGGHYGAVLVTPTDTGDSQKVQIDQVISSLLFVKKLGGEVYRLNLVHSSISNRIFALPGTVDVRFQNSGNVHVIPRGLVTITDPRGTVVKRGVINADSGIALPETFRELKTPLETLSPAWLPGRYTLTTSYRYDDQTKNTTVTSTFWYFDGRLLLIVVAVLALIGFAIFHRPTKRMIRHNFNRVRGGAGRMIRTALRHRSK